MTITMDVLMDGAYAQYQNQNQNPNPNQNRFPHPQQHASPSRSPLQSQSKAQSNRRDSQWLQQHIHQYADYILQLQKSMEDTRFGRPLAYASSTISNYATRRTPLSIQHELSGVRNDWATLILLVYIDSVPQIKHHHHRFSSDSVPSASASYPSPQFLPSTTTNSTLLFSSNSPQFAVPTQPPPESINKTIAVAIAFLNWLERVHAESLPIQRTGDVSFRRTLRRIQHNIDQVNMDADVDSEFRNGAKIFDRYDVEEEEAMLNNVWQLLRAGNIQEAAEICRLHGQSWRAASILGESEISDGANTTHIHPNEQRRFAWKEACARLSMGASPGSIESAIYGVLSGISGRALNHCKTWTDTLWVLTRQLIQSDLDKSIETKLTSPDELASIKNLRALTMKNNTRSCSTMKDIFSLLSDSHDPHLSMLVNSATNSPYHQLHQFIVLEMHPEIERYLVSIIKENFSNLLSNDPILSTNPRNSSLFDSDIKLEEKNIHNSWLFMSVIIYLFLHPKCPEEEPLNEYGELIVVAYVRWLVGQDEKEKVLAYCAYLPDTTQAREYVRFLRSLSNSDERQHYLNRAKEEFPLNHLNITKLWVNNVVCQSSPSESATIFPSTPLRISGEPSHIPGSSLSFQEPSTTLSEARAEPVLPSTADVTEYDRECIRALDCFDISSNEFELVAEAVSQANYLFRNFVLNDHFASANELSESLTRRRLDAAIVLQSPPMDAKSDIWIHNVREYRGWRKYVNSLNWYNTWALQQSTASRNLSVQLDDGDASAVVQQTISAITECLQFENGWMCPMDGTNLPTRHEDELRQIRFRCVPMLVFSLLHLCLETKNISNALQVADLVADAKYLLYLSFSENDLQALLRKLQDAWLRRLASSVQ